MPKKKVNPAEEPEQTTGLMGQAGEELPAPPGEPPQDMGAPEGALPISGDNPGPPEDGEGDTPEVMAVDAATFPVPPDRDPEDAPPMEPPGIVPGDGQPLDTQEPGPDGGKPTEDDPPTHAVSAQAGDDAPPPEPPDGDAPPVPPLTERQSFFALDFHELDRGLSQEERQAWNSIYASFRGHSALSGTVIGADPHSMNVRNRETGRVERRTMYCVVVLVYRVPVYIPATEMWMGEARPDYVLQNMMGASIDFIITKVDREGGYAIASRRQASRAQRDLLISVKETETNPFEGAEQRHPVGSRRYAVIAGKYGGGVFCNLPDGTVCMCNYSYQHEDSEFQSGDHVTLVVQRFERDKRQMYGKILSKR